MILLSSKFVRKEKQKIDTKANYCQTQLCTNCW